MKKLLLLSSLLFLLANAGQAQTIPSYVPSNGLVGWWPFNGNAIDESTNGNNGTMFGPSLTSDRFGAPNSAFEFNGFSDYIEMTDNGMPSGLSSYSFNAWIYLNQPQNNSWCTILSYGTNNNTNADDGKSNEFWITSNINPTQLLSNNHRNRANRATVDSINYRGAWHMLTFTKPIGDSLGAWYFDGQPIPTSDQNLGASRNIQLSGIMRIGRALTNVSPYQYYWFGKLDDIGVWNRALTQQEITNLYTASTLTTTPCSPLASNLTNGLVGYWPFCGNAQDESGLGNNGIVSGSTLTSDRFGNANSAYLFDGVNDYIRITDNSNYSFGTGGFTYSFWFNCNSVPSSCTNTSPYILGQSDILTGSNANGYLFGRYCTSKFRFINQDQINYPNNPLLMEPQNSIATAVWYHVTVTRSGNLWTLYWNGSPIATSTDSRPLSNPIANLIVGNTDLNLSNPSHNGKIDDLGIWNRALTQNEITQLYTGSPCITYQTITVTDTLIINANLTGINPVTFQNSIKVYPNPASTSINIDFGSNYATLVGYSMRIDNSIGQTVYTTPVNQQLYTSNLNGWSGNGLYLIYLLNPQGAVVDVRKIVIQ